MTWEAVYGWLRFRRYVLADMKRRRLEKIAFAVAWKAPHWLVYYCGIRLWANATTGEFGNEEAPAVKGDTIVERWASRRGGDPSFQR
jgi:hypothetical protein